ncbi:MAG: hypothetical protein V4642_10175 [Bacteroidota bacterium]
MNSELQIITKRVEKLEQKNHFLQRLNFFLIGAFSVAIFIGWTQYSVPKVIEAERFVLKDSSGKVRSAWYSDVFKNDDMSYTQSRMEFYNEKNDTNIMLGFKREYNKPLLYLQTTEAIFDSVNPITWKMRLYPTRLDLQRKFEHDSLFGNGVSLENLWQPSLSMDNSGKEYFEMSVQDTGMTIQRHGSNPNIIFESNGKDDGECLNCDEKSVKKAMKNKKIKFMTN